ncbi:MAG: outer membrane protein assembly factor BamC [Pseudomonadota bacterium]
MNISIRTPLLPVLLLTLLVSLNGCSTLFGDKKVDYHKSGKLPPLEVPPDLTQPSADDRYIVPDSKTASGSTTLSAYAREREAQQSGVTAGQSALLPALDKARVERSGAQRWLSVKTAPEQVWPAVRQFWLDAGYELKTENAQIGVMETEWLEGKPKMPETGLRALFQRTLGSFYSTGFRDKFRTRLERSADGGTEIYVSHRGMEEVYEGAGSDRTVWQPRQSDPELEADMLRKLLVKFGADEEKVKTATSDTGTPRARLITNADNTGRLLVGDPFDRAWRRVGLALDRVGFTVEDRDRSKGTYFVRYIDPQAEAAPEKKGLFSRWLSSKNDNKVAVNKTQYRIRVSEAGEESAVEVQSAAGDQDKTSTGNRILSLLFDQLK